MQLTVAVWYYFNDIYPPLHNNHSPLDPPAWWIRLIEGRPASVEEPTEAEATVPNPNNENAADAVLAQ
jgi:Derlin-2/3